MSEQIEKVKEITLSDIIKVTKECFEIIKTKSLYIILITIMSALAFGLYANWSDKSYSANLSFMINENESSTGIGGGAASILGSLGITGGAEYNLDKILALSKSSKIIQTALLQKKVIQGKEDMIANHMIELYKLREVWKGDKFLKNFDKFRNSNFDSLDLSERAAIKVLTTSLVGTGETGSSGLFNSKNNRASSIMTLSLVTNSEELTLELLKTIYQTLSSFYITKAIEKDLSTHTIIKRKVDSIQGILYGKEMAQAQFNDSHYGLLSEKPLVPQRKITRDIGVLNVMYAEAVKNAEITDFALKNKTPFIQAIDIPMSPIIPNAKSWKRYLIYGFLLGFFASVSSFLLIHFLNNRLVDADKY